MEALGNNDLDKAKSYADQAIRVEPKEGHFYALKGDINFKRQKYSKAIEKYDKAINLNDSFFYYYLRRGLTKDKLHMSRDAYADLQASTKLLPTATAYNALGVLELSSGTPYRAKEYFAAAASSDSPEGRSARVSLARLDLADNPGKYLKIDYGLDRAGYLVARITNNAPVAVQNIQMSIEYPDAKGRIRYATRWFSGTIPPNNKYTVNLDLGPYSSSKVLQSIRIGINSAELAE